MDSGKQEQEPTHTLHVDTLTLENIEKGEKGEKTQNEIQNLQLDINSFDVVNYITLETMSNNDSYNKYLKRNKMDHDAVLKREKKFYRKRIIALTKDILFNNVNNVPNPTPNASGELANPPLQVETPKIDDIIISAFNTYARLCISHFKFKDTMDTIQGEYKDMNIENKDNVSEDGNQEESMSNNINEANKLCMKQNDKKILTLDNFVIKTSAPKKEMILPKTKNVNLKDPKFKKKDIKVSMSTPSSTSTTTTIIPTTTKLN
jgi:hypothetical protein